MWSSEICCNLQAEDLQTCASGSGPLTNQMAAVLAAASFKAVDYDVMQQFHQITMLIISLLIKDVSDRWSAVDMCSDNWFVEAVWQRRVLDALMLYEDGVEQCFYNYQASTVVTRSYDSEPVQSNSSSVKLSWWGVG